MKKVYFILWGVGIILFYIGNFLLNNFWLGFIPLAAISTWIVVDYLKRGHKLFEK
jgi:hypothetical protein